MLLGLKPMIWYRFPVRSDSTIVDFHLAQSGKDHEQTVYPPVFFTLHIHSTDTHGYSEAIFAATHLLGFSYAPRIKNLKKQSLYIFKSRKNTDRSKWKITPDKYVNEGVIEDNWDDFLRLIVTIKLK